MASLDRVQLFSYDRPSRLESCSVSRGCVRQETTASSRYFDGKMMTVTVDCCEESESDDGSEEIRYLLYIWT